MKKQVLCLVALVGLLCSAQVQAATTPAAAPAKPLTAQQTRMKDCNAQYKAQGIPKAQHQSFMSTCLKKPGTATSSAAPTATPASTTSSVKSSAPASSASTMAPSSVSPTATPAPAANVPSSMTPPASAMKP